MCSPPHSACGYSCCVVVVFVLLLLCCCCCFSILLSNNTLIAGHHYSNGEHVFCRVNFFFAGRGDVMKSQHLVKGRVTKNTRATYIEGRSQKHEALVSGGGAGGHGFTCHKHQFSLVLLYII